MYIDNTDEGARTPDSQVKSLTLCQLSYNGFGVSITPYTNLGWKALSLQIFTKVRWKTRYL